MRSRTPRPTGVTLIALLAILVGSLGFFGSLTILGSPVLVARIGATIGGVILVSSLVWLLVGWGYLKGKGWAWILGMISSILSMISAIGAIAAGQAGGVVGLLIWGLMLYYLTRPRVKAFFRKGGMLLATTYPGVIPVSQASTDSAIGPQPLVSPGLTFAPLTHPSSVPLSEVESQPAHSQGSSSAARIVVCPSCRSELAKGTHKCPACGASV